MIYLLKLIDETRLAIGRQSHHFALVAVMGKPEKLGRGRVNNPERVRIFDLTQDLDRVPCSGRPHRGNKVAETVDR
mgnify:CR=1 FL=1